jgi:hypothetical protein
MFSEIRLLYNTYFEQNLIGFYKDFQSQDVEVRRNTLELHVSCQKPRYQQSTDI